jgi:hypothetical protein
LREYSCLLRNQSGYLGINLGGVLRLLLLFRHVSIQLAIKTRDEHDLVINDLKDSRVEAPTELALSSPLIKADSKLSNIVECVHRLIR